MAALKAGSLSMEDPAIFILSVVTILCTPGPSNTLLATSGAMKGVRRSLILLPAECSGYLVSIVTLGLVLGPLVVASSALDIGLRLVIAVYLACLAMRLWKQATIWGAQIAVVGPWQQFITTLLNPKAIVFALGVIPFASDHVWMHLLGFVLMDAIIGFGWILVGSRLGYAVHARGLAKLVPRAGATALSAFAVLIVASFVMKWT